MKPANPESGSQTYLLDKLIPNVTRNEDNTQDNYMTDKAFLNHLYLLSLIYATNENIPYNNQYNIKTDNGITVIITNADKNSSIN